tara:strand:+ start:56 stop:550 length:495 start_codon:yes stop_codon:yes gene_type:complete
LSSKILVDEIAPKTTGGFVDMTKPVLCKIYVASDFAVAASTFTEVPFSTLVFDTHNLADLSNNGITIPSGMGGYYHIKGRVRAPMTTQRIITQFFINDSSSEFFEQAGYTDNTGQLGVVEADTILVLNAGDTLTLQTYHDYASSRNFISGINSCNMLVHRIGAS